MARMSGVWDSSEVDNELNQRLDGLVQSVDRCILNDERTSAVRPPSDGGSEFWRIQLRILEFW
jgi:hypothetical protein